MKTRVLTKINALLQQFDIDELLETLHYMESIADKKHPSRPHRREKC